MSKRILLAHGGGGELTRKLIDEHILARLGNEFLNPLTDSAVLPVEAGRICLTTDSFVVTPLEFPGGDIGRLAVCGTINDLCVMGAEPLALTLGLIIEEGLPLEVLDRVLDSVALAAEEAGVRIVTGDTKVIERRQGDGLFINTAGVGVLRHAGIGAERIVAGDRVIVTGGIAEHGLAVMSAREGLAFETELKSDAAPLNGLVKAMLESGADIKFMRDPTRGGVAGVLADLSETTGLSIEITEAAVPMTQVVWHTAELLGLDPLTVANEGKVVVVVSSETVAQVLRVCRAHPYGRDAAEVGGFTGATPALVELISRAGGRRILQRPYGEELPRIC